MYNSPATTLPSRFQAFVIKSLLLPMILLSAPSGLRAESQSSKEEAEEIVMLSPFEVSAAGDQGYATNTIAGTRVRTNLKDVGSAISVVTAQFLQDTLGAAPQMPITVVKRADAMVIQFALAATGDKADARNTELTNTIDAISTAIKNTPGLRFEPREIMLASADRTKTLIGKGGIVTSYAHFVIFSDFSDGMRPYQRVKQVRDLLTGLKISTATTKLLDGPVGLYIRQPSQYRAELLAKIFADLEVVKKGLGAEFEVFVSGLNGGMKMRTCSETDIELWLDYSFTIRSIRELEARKSDKK